ncbi:hypothetical protein [Mucilaginibacter lacusdianchii]|uniref:hypothetical protein n=1 Tax=Mucilaginibacter lacusdianchii TaxID=2684211 RepID=UPI00131D7CAC|nr:hypothetical protein [Mucilaginibacter sp. JXJ CY 39]
MSNTNSDRATKNLVFLSHGDKLVHYEIVFCLHTLYYHLKGDFTGLQITIYTDDISSYKKYLSSFPIVYEILTKQQIAEYRKPYGYIHRVKACVMKLCMEKYPIDMMFLDGDTFFTKYPWPLFNKISPEVCVMNIDEYDLVDGGDHENSYWLDLRHNVRNNTYLIKGKETRIPLTTRMWNSGFTGISYQNASLLDDNIEVIDQVYGKGEVFHIEQFALSYVLQNATRIVDTEDYIVHYYYKITDRKYFDYHLVRFLKKYKGKPVQEIAEKAIELAKHYETVTIPKYVHLYDTILLRYKNIKKVTFKGRL